MKFQELCKKLEDKIKNSYEQGVTLEDAEKLAGEFLHAQIVVAGELKKSDLDARMRKSGVKAIKAAVYLDTCSKADKKPTEAQITAIIDSDKIVIGEQEGLDLAEVTREDLERYYDIFRESHIYFRSIAKGKFD